LKTFSVLAASLVLVGCRHAAPEPRLDVRMVTDEADAVLAILETRAAGRTATEDQWKRLFSTDGYQRLKRREASLGRAFEDASFREFVLSDDLLARAADLRRTRDAWARIDPADAARRAFAYLPDSAVIRARIYPSIKPRTNSFVFEPSTDPAIFLYLDPKVTPKKLANTVTHELHHIGVGSACKDREWSGVSQETKTALDWMTGFAEGRAVLAAAGGPDVHPHPASTAEERAVWDRQFARVGEDLRRLESFFIEILDGKLSGDELNRKGMAFISTDDVPQGAYYTVGWLMATTVERELGRERLVASLCDPPRFLRDYEAAARKRGDASLPMWSPAFLGRLPS
jgi:hypothetical protein